VHATPLPLRLGSVREHAASATDCTSGLPAREAGDPRSWRERLAAARHLPKLLRLVWSTEPRYVVGIVVLRILRAVVPLAVLWIGKLIVDAVIAAAATATPVAPRRGGIWACWS
jgi:hypothetical protein